MKKEDDEYTKFYQLINETMKLNYPDGVKVGPLVYCFMDIIAHVIIKYNIPIDTTIKLFKSTYDNIKK